MIDKKISYFNYPFCPIKTDANCQKQAKGHFSAEKNIKYLQFLKKLVIFAPP
jgi:hypothetical protein